MDHPVCGGGRILRIANSPMWIDSSADRVWRDSLARLDAYLVARGDEIVIQDCLVFTHL